MYDWIDCQVGKIAQWVNRHRDIMNALCAMLFFGVLLFILLNGVYIASIAIFS